MLRRCEATKYINIGGPGGRLCPNFFNSYLLFLTIVFIFLDLDLHLTHCPMDIHKKGRGPKLLKRVIYTNFCLVG
jgi:hypothetical protein